jgi:hypothetical protein
MRTISILPELVSGRGTARRSRVVEGQPQDRLRDNSAHYGIKVRKHLASRDSQSLDSSGTEPRVSRGVSLGSTATVMRFSVELDGEPRIAAEEVEIVRPGRMLASELQTCGSGSKHLPEEHFREAHFAAQAACLPNRSSSASWRDVLEHGVGPSTMLRMVPLPETSSGRILG